MGWIVTWNTATTATSDSSVHTTTENRRVPIMLAILVVLCDLFWTLSSLQCGAKALRPPPHAHLSLLLPKA
jgi:hypothetical protein